MILEFDLFQFFYTFFLGTMFGGRFAILLKHDIKVNVNKSPVFI